MLLQFPRLAYPCIKSEMSFKQRDLLFQTKNEKLGGNSGTFQVFISFNHIISQSPKKRAFAQRVDGFPVPWVLYSPN